MTKLTFGARAHLLGFEQLERLVEPQKMGMRPKFSFVISDALGCNKHQPGVPDRRPLGWKYGRGEALHKARRVPRFLPARTKIICIRPRKQATNSSKLSTARKNAPSELNFEEMLRSLEVLRREHRDLDDAIHALASGGRADQLTLQRLKRQEAVRSRPDQIEDQLIPDIIAWNPPSPATRAERLDLRA